MKVKIDITAEEIGDILEALDEISNRIEMGDTKGSDANSELTNSFSFEVSE